MPLTHITYITWDDILINAVLLWILIKTIILWNWWDVTLPSTISNHSLHPVFSFHLSILTSKKNIPKRKWTLSIFFVFWDGWKERNWCLWCAAILPHFSKVPFTNMKPYKNTTILHLPSSSISILACTQCIMYSSIQKNKRIICIKSISYVHITKVLFHEYPKTIYTVIIILAMQSSSSAPSPPSPKKSTM